MKIKYLVLFIAAFLTGLPCKAKEKIDTLYSSSGDRIILNYGITQNGGQITVKFGTVHKKLGQRNLSKYKKLNEVAVVMFDRTGNYREIKFDGMGTEAFMVPSNLNYSRSQDGYFLLQDEPTLSFSLTSGNKAQVNIPLYLAHYEGKRHYKVFAKCGNLVIESKAGQGKKGRPAAGGRVIESDEGGYESVSSVEEEVVDGGVSPIDEASIRITTINSLLERATKLPLSEDLTHEVQMLKELRFKVTDPAVTAQISQVLESYENKKQELEQKADASAKAEQAAQEAKAQQALARSDSLNALQALQAAKDKKDLLWVILGIVGSALAFLGGKQVYQQWCMKKMQKNMMDSMKNMMNPGASAGLGNMMNGMTGANNPLGNIINQQQRKAEQAVKRTLSKEAEAARQKLMQMKHKDTPMAQNPSSEQRHAASTPQRPAPKKPSLNDAIPRKYKRWRKPGTEDNSNNVTI